MIHGKFWVFNFLKKPLKIVALGFQCHLATSGQKSIFNLAKLRVKNLSFFATETSGLTKVYEISTETSGKKQSLCTSNSISVQK
jgi:hypothetical protein